MNKLFKIQTQGWCWITDCRIENGFGTPILAMNSPNWLTQSLGESAEMCLRHTRTVSHSLLRKFHLGLLKTGRNLADYSRIPNIVFDTTTTRGYPERFMLLKKAQEIRRNPKERQK